MNKFNIGDVVKIDFEKCCEDIEFEISNKKDLDYICENEDKCYLIDNIVKNLDCPYVLDDKNLSHTSFRENELIFVSSV